MPLALIFAFVCDMGIAGLWLGFSIACIILDIGFYFIISCANWEMISKKMQSAMAEEAEVRKSVNASHLSEHEVENVINTPAMNRKEVLNRSIGHSLHE